MNTISNSLGQFPVAELSSFKSVELFDSQYLVRKIEKGTGKNSLGCVIPAITAEEFVSALENETILAEMVSSYQELIAETVKAKISAGANLILSDDFSLDSVVSFVDSRNVSEGRISKEKIWNWFRNEVSPILDRALKEKFGASISNDKILQTLAMYQNAFGMFAKREHSFSDSTFENVKKVLDLIPDSGMKQFCNKKLNDFAPKTVDMLAL